MIEYNIPDITIDEDLTEDLENIESVIDDLNTRRDKGLSKTFQAKLNKQIMVSHVYHSNAIEGNMLTIRETELILDGMVVNERPIKDELEAKSLANATNYLHDIITGTEQLNERTLKELHGLILETTDSKNAGRYRSNEVNIKNSEHEPPSFLDIDQHIQELFKWMNRNMHKYNPIIMGSIVHHWLTWIHPFADGNGRVSRLFLNFFLLQKGYPEIIIRIEDRDKYYDALIDADNGKIEKLVNLICKNTRSSVDIIEEFINEEDRQKEWIQNYNILDTTLYEKAREKYKYQYEVWKNQMEVFKTLFVSCVSDLSDAVESIYDFELDDYPVISLNQYLDLLEGKKVTNTWYMKFRIFQHSTKHGENFIFFAQRFAQQKPFKLLGKEVIDSKTGKVKLRDFNPEVKLYVQPKRKKGEEKYIKDEISLRSIGSYKDNLVFGVRHPDNVRRIVTEHGKPRKHIQIFIDQLLKHYFSFNLN